MLRFLLRTVVVICAYAVVCGAIAFEKGMDIGTLAGAWANIAGSAHGLVILAALVIGRFRGERKGQSTEETAGLYGTVLVNGTHDAYGNLPEFSDRGTSLTADRD